MAALQNHRGQPLTDADGQVLKVGSMKRGERHPTHLGRHARERRGRCAPRWREGAKEVSWSVPDGFEVADEPSKLDDTLVGGSVYMRWEKYGWQLGRITDIVIDATLCVFKKFNYRITWADGTARGQQSSVLRTMAMDQMLAITHGQFYLAQSLRCKRAVCRPVR